MDVFNTYLKAKLYSQTHIERKVDPTTNDDTFRIGTFWSNPENSTVWICVDNTKGAAIWVKVDDLEGLLSTVLDHESRISDNETNISNNAAAISAIDLSDIEGAVGAVDEASINYSSNNYITDAVDLVTSLGTIDTALKSINNITDGLGTAAVKNFGTSPGNLVELDGGGLIPTSVLPSLAVTDVYVVADIAARDALVVQEGDVCNVTADPTPSNNGWYIYDGSSWLDFTPTITTLAASSVTYNNGTSGLTATDAQAAIDELAGSVADHEITTFFVNLGAAGGGDGSKSTPFNNIEDVVTARNLLPDESVRIYYYSTGVTVSSTQVTYFTSSVADDVFTEIIGIGVSGISGADIPRMEWDDFRSNSSHTILRNIDLEGTMDPGGLLILDRCVVHSIGTSSAEIYMRGGYFGAASDVIDAVTANIRYGNPFIIEGPVRTTVGITKIRFSGIYETKIFDFETDLAVEVINTNQFKAYNSQIRGKIDIDDSGQLYLYNSFAEEVECLAIATLPAVLARNSHIEILTSSNAASVITLYESPIGSFTNTAGTTLNISDVYSGITKRTISGSSSPLNFLGFDEEAGYPRGALWVNDNRAFINIDNTNGSSKWRHIGQDTYAGYSQETINGALVQFTYLTKGQLRYLNPADNIASIELLATATTELENGDWIDFIVDAGVTVSSVLTGGATVTGANPISGGHSFTTQGFIRVVHVSTDTYLITAYNGALS